MNVNKIKTIIMSAAMLLGMGLVAVPQAIAGGSVFATYKLPFGLELGKPPTAKVKLYKDSNDNYILSRISTFHSPEIFKLRSVGVQTSSGQVISVVFFDKPPKVWRGIFDSSIVGMGYDKVKALIRQQGGIDVSEHGPSKELDDEENRFISADFGPYRYHFSFMKGKDKGLSAIEITEGLAF